MNKTDFKHNIQRFVVKLSVEAWAVLLLAWSLYMSWFAGEILGGWVVQVSFCIISVSFCLAARENRGGTLWWWPVFIFGLFFEIFGSYVIFSNQSSIKSTLSDTELQAMMTEYQADKQREIEDYLPYKLRSAQKSEAGQSLGSDLLAAKKKHDNAMSKTQSKIDSTRNQLNKTHHKAAYDKMSDQFSVVSIKVSPEDLEGVINWLRVFALVFCYIYSWGLGRRIAKYFPDKPSQIEHAPVNALDNRPEVEISDRLKTDVNELQRVVARPAEVDKSDEKVLYESWLKAVLIEDIKPIYSHTAKTFDIDKPTYSKWVERALNESKPFKSLAVTLYAFELSEYLKEGNEEPEKALEPFMRSVEQEPEPVAEEQLSLLDESTNVTPIEPMRQRKSQLSEDDNPNQKYKHEADYESMLEDIKAGKVSLRWVEIKEFYGRKTQSIWWTKFLEWGVLHRHFEKNGRVYQLTKKVEHSD